MRTTLTIDDDLAAILARETKRKRFSIRGDGVKIRHLGADFQ